MKLLLTALLFAIASHVSAQIVNIPDALFKQSLLEYVPVIDTNGDGEIQVSEAQAVTNLGISGGVYQITDITGIRSFSNLDTLLTIELTGVTDVDISSMPFLRYADLNGVKFQTINAANCPNLQTLYVYNDIVTGADSVAYLNVTGDHQLKLLNCSILNVPELDLRECDSLHEFYMAIGDIHEMLNVSGLTKLERITAEGHVGTINAVNATGLNSIKGDGYNSAGVHIDDMFLTNCTALEYIGNVFFDGTYLDLSSCVSLNSFGFNAPYLQYLNIKNGSSVPTGLLGQNFGIYIGDNPNPSPLYVCTDDFETHDVDSILMEMNGSSAPITVNSFCSPSPGGSFNTIKGKVRVDVNNNGCDNADEVIANVPVRVSNGTYSTIRYSSNSGDYRHYDFAGNFTVTPYFPYPYFSISPGVGNVVFDTANNLIDTLDFCISPNGIHNQLEITMVPVGGARPGFRSYYQLMFRNRGTTTLSGNVQVNFDNSKMNFQSSPVPPSSQSQGLLSWNYSNLLPLESRYIDVTFLLFAPPVNNIGDTLLYLAAANPVAGDETPSNNSFVLPQGVVNSFDPNDKTCLEGHKLDITRIGDILHYIIHFQNMGTDTAFNVVVTDTLTNNLDWESFDLLGSSHACNVKRVNNHLEFYFQNIRLPYQAINDAGSNGFVAFEIRSNNTLVAGDSINNTASIYFDFNPPIVTNMATTIVSIISPVPVKLEYFSLSSKNEVNILTWKIATSDLSTNFSMERSADGIHFNSIGNITAATERCQLPFNFTDDKPLAGKNYYRLKITDANGFSFYSKVLVAGRNGNNTIFYVNVLKDQTVHMEVIASDGKLMFSQTKTISAGTTQLNLPLKNLAKGVYTLLAYTTDGEIVTKRFIK